MPRAVAPVVLRAAARARRRPSTRQRYSRRIADLTPKWRRVPADATPFKAGAVARSEIMIFNIADYGHTLLNDFFITGGQFRHAEFQAPLADRRPGQEGRHQLYGYGARALWKDETLTPVRGQIARLIPQPDVRYGLVYRQVIAVPRRDGIVIQSFEGGEMKGYGDTNETPDRAEAEQAGDDPGRAVPAGARAGMNQSRRNGCHPSPPSPCNSSTPAKRARAGRRARRTASPMPRFSAQAEPLAEVRTLQ